MDSIMPRVQFLWANYCSVLTSILTSTYWYHGFVGDHQENGTVRRDQVMAIDITCTVDLPEMDATICAPATLYRPPQHKCVEVADIAWHGHYKAWQGTDHPYN